MFFRRFFCALVLFVLFSFFCSCSGRGKIDFSLNELRYFVNELGPRGDSARVTIDKILLKKDKWNKPEIAYAYIILSPNQNLINIQWISNTPMANRIMISYDKMNVYYAIPESCIKENEATTSKIIYHYCSLSFDSNNPIPAFLRDTENANVVLMKNDKIISPPAKIVYYIYDGKKPYSVKE